VQKLPPGTPVKPDLAYFGTAYAELRHGNFDRAAKAFIAMADRYPIKRDSHSFVLPYFAFAASKTGDELELEEYIRNHPKTDKDFDYLLAKAFFAGARKNAEQAKTLLEKAFRVRPHTDYRPILTEYQYAEACEWLYLETRDARFVDMLLEWTYAYQRIQPTHAWACSMEFAYGRTKAQRIRALAMTLYLDPRSERISTAKAEELEEAQKWLQQNNPFLARPLGTEARLTFPLQAGEQLAFRD
jgi:hypothetical protein